MQKQIYSPKAIVETGMMFALITLIIIMTTKIPVLSFMGMFILPIPIIVIYVRYNYKFAFITTVMSIILTSFLYGLMPAFISGVAYGLTGCTFGYCIKNNKKSSVTLILVSISIFIGNIITYLIYALFIGKAGIVNTLNNSIDIIRKYYIDMRNIYIQQSGAESIVNKINDMIQVITIRNMLIVLPIVLILYSFIQGYISYLITRNMLKKLKYKVQKMVSFSEMYISNRIIAVTIIITCLGIILNGKEIRFADDVSSAFEILAMMLILFDGMASVTYFLRRKYKKSKGFTFFILIIGLIMPMFQDVYLIIGLLDIILNLRRLDPDPIRKIKSRE
ncbi:YybS family protein [Clostridium botulinum]|nr:YybS family protein [Clostridium botulinum]